MVPKWLAGAKDRNKFLIDGAANAARNEKATAGKTAPAVKKPSQKARAKTTARSIILAASISNALEWPAV